LGDGDIDPAQIEQIVEIRRIMIGSTRMLSPSSRTLRISSTKVKAVPEPFPAAIPTVQELMRSFISCSVLLP
jgi:hypothetical protein